MKMPGISRAWWLAIAGWLPLGAMLFLIGLFDAAIPRDLPVAVHDASNDTLSRGLVRAVEASPALSVDQHVTSYTQGVELLTNGNVEVLLVIPAGLERTVQLGRQPVISALVNGQFLLTAKAADSSLQLLEAEFEAYLRTRHKLASGEIVIQSALAAAAPLGVQASALYNLALDYGRFLLPGLFAALYQALIACLTVLAWREGSKVAGERLLLLTRLTMVFCFQGLLIFAVIWHRSETPDVATMLQLPALLVLFTLACQGLGLLFAWLAGDTVRALSIVGAFSAPSFAFLGLTFPGSDMSPFAAFWRELMPATHFVEAYIAVANYSAPLATFAPALALTFFLPGWLVLFRNTLPDSGSRPDGAATMSGQNG